jgi:hypothetical protein
MSGNSRSARVLAVAATTCALLGTTLPPAAASWHRDQNDTSYQIDIKSARMTHDHEKHTFTFVITTYDKFRLVWRLKGSIWWVIDSRGGPGWDTKLRLWRDWGSSGVFCDGRPYPILWDGDGSDRQVWCRINPKKGWKTKPVRYAVIIKDKRRDLRDRAPEFGLYTS